MPIHNPPREVLHEEDCFTTVICQSELETVLRDGAHRMLVLALEAEVETYLRKHQAARDEGGRRLVVRNGHGAERPLFDDFPAEHWRHMRTTNPIESSCATIRHRANQTKGCGSRLATLALVFQLGRECEKSWRCLNGSAQIPKLIQGVRFIDGIAEKVA